MVAVTCLTTSLLIVVAVTCLTILNTHWLIIVVELALIEMTLIGYCALLILSAVAFVTVVIGTHVCIVASMWGNTYASDVLLVNQGQIDVVDGDIVLVELYSQ